MIPPPAHQNTDAFQWMEDVADTIVEHPVLIDMFIGAINRAIPRINTANQHAEEQANE